MTPAELITFAQRLRDSGLDPDRLAIKVTPEEWTSLLTYSVSGGMITDAENVAAITAIRQGIMGVEIWKRLP